MSKKEPSLLHKLIDIHFEQCKRRKALRNLQKLEWSVDFLSLIVSKAAKNLGKNISFTITNKDGIKLEVTRVSDNIAKIDESDDIFDQLDNDAAVDDFIRRNSSR